MSVDPTACCKDEMHFGGLKLPLMLALCSAYMKPLTTLYSGSFSKKTSLMILMMYGMHEAASRRCMFPGYSRD